MRRLLLFLGALGALLTTSVAAPLAAEPTVKALDNCSVADWSIDGEEARFLQLINDYRVANGEVALTLSDSLNRSAAWIATDMGANNSFGHTDSLGRGAWDRIVDCGYPIAGGENLAAGTNRSTADSAFELFRNSPSHNENMLLARYRQIGIARVYAPGTTYGWYWATTFGTLGEAPAPPPPPPPPAAAAPQTQPASQPAAQGSAGAVAQVQPRLPQMVVQLAAGPNRVEWAGPGATPAEIAARANASMLYAWDEGRQTWVHYGPGLPAYLQTMGPLVQGDVVWVIANAPGSLDMR